MKYLYLVMSFNKSQANNFPIVSIEQLEDWDGERGTYQKGAWMCSKSYLNHVVSQSYTYKYEMVISAEPDDYNTINESVQFAFNKVKEYVEKEVQERISEFNRIQEFLDAGGYPLKPNELN